MNKLICILLAICIFCNLPVQAQIEEMPLNTLEDVIAATKDAFHKVTVDMQKLKESIDANSTLTSAMVRAMKKQDARIEQLEKRRKHRAVESLTRGNHGQ